MGCSRRRTPRQAWRSTGRVGCGWRGAVRDVLSFARRVITVELGSIVDNPVIVPDGEVMTTGNFHDEPLAFAADMLAIAVAAQIAAVDELLPAICATAQQHCPGFA
jgi:histidine ammonia-lyase